MSDKRHTSTLSFELLRRLTVRPYPTTREGLYVCVGSTIDRAVFLSPISYFSLKSDRHFRARNFLLARALCIDMVRPTLYFGSTTNPITKDDGAPLPESKTAHNRRTRCITFGLTFTGYRTFVRPISAEFLRRVHLEECFLLDLMSELILWNKASWFHSYKTRCERDPSINIRKAQYRPHLVSCPTVQP